MGERPSYDEYFMGMAHLVSKRSTCLRRSVGAILVKKRHILSTGYNGAPKGHKHCSEVGCLREKLGVLSGERHEICRGLHAEQNAILFARQDLSGCAIFITAPPCSICAAMIIQSGIKKVFCKMANRDFYVRWEVNLRHAKDMLKQAEVTICEVDNA